MGRIVEAVESGRVQWERADGDLVKQFDPICSTTFVAYSAPCAGVLRRMAVEQVEEGEALYAVEPPGAAPARAVAPLVEEIVIEPPAVVAPVPEPVRIVKYMTHITDQQRNGVAAAAETLANRGRSYAAAELQRLAFSLLLALSEAELAARLEAQREREAQGGYGWGNRS